MHNVRVKANTNSLKFCTVIYNFDKGNIKYDHREKLLNFVCKAFLFCRKRKQDAH